MNQSPPFGLVIPGLPVQYNFEQIGDKGQIEFSFCRVITVQNPKSINVISFFMNYPLGDYSLGAALYFSTPPEYSSLSFIGAIANMRPSDIFHTGWALNPQINTLPEIKLVIAVEPLEKLETCVKISQDTDLSKEFAKKVAQNLFNFMYSFNQISDQQTAQNNVLVVPSNTLDKWYDKFMRKYELDPNFIYKSQE